MAKIRRCWYCNKENTDHKHGAGYACGDCCAMHGGLSEDNDTYMWVKKCLIAKNRHIAALEAENAQLSGEEERSLAAKMAKAIKRLMLKYEPHNVYDTDINYAKAQLTKYNALTARSNKEN